MLTVKRLKVFYPSGKEFVHDVELTRRFRNLVNKKFAINAKHGMIYSGIECFTDSFCKINVFDYKIYSSNFDSVSLTLLANETAEFRVVLKEKGFTIEFEEFGVDTLEEVKSLGNFIEIKEVNGISNISEILRSQR